MNQAQYEDMVAQAEAYVKLGERHIDRQREIIAELDLDGHDTDLARELLARYEELQHEQMAHRDRLRELRAILSSETQPPAA